MTIHACVPIEPPKKYIDELCKRAVAMNPKNKPSGRVEPQRISVMTTKLWPQSRDVLTVSFMDSTTPAFRDKIIRYANKWHCGIEFKYTSGPGSIRISTGSGGYYAYLGTDMASIPTNRHNMNLERFTVSTRDSEWDRVCCHEFAHALGSPHEHSRQEIIDLLKPEGCYSYFRRTSGWSRRTVDQQILTVQPESGLTSTDPDVSSIMCYQFAGECTWTGQPIPGGLEISDQDRAFMQDVYPPDVDPEEPVDPDPLPDEGDDWDLSKYEEVDWS